jgi:hypothetical protein
MCHNEVNSSCVALLQINLHEKQNLHEEIIIYWHNFLKLFGKIYENSLWHNYFLSSNLITKNFTFRWISEMTEFRIPIIYIYNAMSIPTELNLQNSYDTTFIRVLFFTLVLDKNNSLILRWKIWFLIIRLCNVFLFINCVIL